MNPGVQIMHSKDLVNWKLASYCIDRLDLGPAFRLEGGNIYGRGIWAPCIRYHDGMFYVFSNVNGVGLQVFRSKSAYGPWQRNQLPGRHDCPSSSTTTARSTSSPATAVPIRSKNSRRTSDLSFPMPPSVIWTRGWARAITFTRSTANTSMFRLSPEVRWTRWSRSPTRSTALGRRRAWSKANRSA